MSLTQAMLRELENVKSGKPSLFVPTDTQGVYVWLSPLKVSGKFAITKIILRTGGWGGDCITTKFYISYLPDPPYILGDSTTEFALSYIQSNLLPAYNDVPVDVVARDLSRCIAGSLRFTIQDSLEKIKL